MDHGGFGRRSAPLPSPSPMLGYALQCNLYFGGDGSLFISPQNAPRINFNIGEGGKGGVCVPSCSTPPNHSVVDSCCPMVVYLSRHGTLCEPSDLSFSFPSPPAPLFTPHSHIQMPSTYEPHSNDTRRWSAGHFNARSRPPRRGGGGSLHWQQMFRQLSEVAPKVVKKHAQSLL